jgi:hypothetical protein
MASEVDFQVTSVGDVASESPVNRRLAEVARLEEDRDSYGGLPPTPAAIRAARRLLLQNGSIPRQGVDPDAVFPFPNGGVQLVWERNADELQVDVGPSGDIGYLWVRRAGGARESSEAELATDEAILTLVDQFVS